MGFVAFVKERSLIEQVANVERLADEYLPKQIQQHIQLGMTDSSTFQEVKDKVLAYERVSASWSRDRVLLECGATSLGTVTSHATAADSGPGPMEVNMASQREKARKVKETKGSQKEKAPVTKAKGKERAQTRAKARDSNGRKVNRRVMQVAATLDSHNNVQSWMQMFALSVEKQAAGPRNVARRWLINNSNKCDWLDQMGMSPNRTQLIPPLEVSVQVLVLKQCVWCRHAIDQPAIRVVQLGMVLRCLADGWNRIHPHLFAIKTKLPRHVDTTLAPSDELMWLRTTLVFREGTAWEVDEYCEPIADLRHNLEEELIFPETVVEVITLAHKYAVPDSDLGFYMYDRARRVEQAVDDDDCEYEPDIAPDPIPEEPPVPDGEPLEEDRVVPFEDDTAVVDGITMNMACTVKTLQASCTSLGLSGRGGKAKCLKRMVDHLRAQTMIAG
eukprot:s4054_g8.t1